MDELYEFSSIGRDKVFADMPGWTARDRQNFVRDTKDGHRVNVYWSVGGYWMILAGEITHGDFEHFVGRGGVCTKSHGKAFWKRLDSARSNANKFAFKHGGWRRNEV